MKFLAFLSKVCHKNIVETV